ncbi:hypothetical protein BGZ94_002470 [Podila epigama]|nr:hypothetical protein BGZ94_002470 [Podila epigama]
MSPQHSNVHFIVRQDSSMGTMGEMIFFKNQTASAAPSANNIPIQTPRSSVQASRPTDQHAKTTTTDKVLDMALNSSPAGGLIDPRPVM